MKHAALLLSVVLVTAHSEAQLNITQLGHLDYQALHGSDLANLWGYTDELGNEYALVGVNGGSAPNTGGLSVVNVTDPANPVEVAFIPGANSIWREIKVWNDHAYVTTEANYGLLIVDLSPLPQSNVLPSVVFHGNGWTTVHSLFIDENGRLYLNGTNRGNRGSIMYDLTQNPMAPVEVGDYNIWYVHDCFARGDTLYAGHIFDGFFSIADVSDPMNPVLLGTQVTPNAFTHNCWLDDSGHHLFTTDEKPDSKVASYDVTDPTDIQFEDTLQTDRGSNAIVHNTYWLNHYTVQSYYTEGVSIYDATYPANMVEVGHYDTSPFTGSGFNGAWGVYPYLPSGNLLVSDIEGGLYILGANYVHACWLQGTITDAITTQPVGGATISIVSTTAGDLSAIDGGYHTGWSTAGTYDVLVHAPGYFDHTTTGVVLQSGQITVLDVALEPMVPFAFTGTVVAEGTNTPIPGAQVILNSVDFDSTFTTDGNGQFTLPTMFAGDYAITAGAWGYHTVCLPSALIDANTSGMTITLPVGYADDFALDLGWSADGNAATGSWVRDAPIGTDDNGTPCAPGADVDGDCGALAYVTGNGGGSPGTDDVDGGFVRLVSPVFDISTMTDPWVRYFRWFFNGGGTTPLNDTLTISLTNGVDTVMISSAIFSTPGAHTWVMEQFGITGLITPTSTMRLIVRTADTPPGHWVEAGLDDFEVLPQSPFMAVGDRPDQDMFSIVPNPGDGRFTVMDQRGVSGQVHVMDAEGREVVRARNMRDGVAVFDTGLSPGVYIVRSVRDDGTLRTARAVVR